MAAHQNADKIIGLAAYMFSEQGQMQDIYFTRQLTGEEMQTRMKDEVIFSSSSVRGVSSLTVGVTVQELTWI